MMMHHPNGERRWSSLKAVDQEQLGPLTSMGTKPRESKAVVPGRVQLLPSGYEKLTIRRDKNEEHRKAQA